MKQLLKHWWNSIPHHSSPDYFNVVSYPFWLVASILLILLYLGMYFGPSNPYADALQSFSNIPK